MRKSGIAVRTSSGSSSSHGGGFRADSPALRKLSTGKLRYGGVDVEKRADTPRQGLWCEHCNTRLIELKRHALKFHLSLQKHGKVSKILKSKKIVYTKIGI